MTNKKPEVINEIMARIAPELASDYAQYPLARDRWLQPNETADRGEPCFIKSSNGSGSKHEIRMDYVYGRGRFGEGYYHLLTKPAYTSLYARLLNNMPMGCCSCFSSKTMRQHLDEYDDTKRIVYNRSVARIPNDAVGLQDAVSQSQQVANAHYNYNQNEQLVVGMVGRSLGGGS